MKLIVGLGNQGKKFKETRHNVGFIAVDQLAKEKKWQKSKPAQAWYTRVEINNHQVELVKPTTLMNRSGRAVAYVKKKHPQLKTKEIIVIHDDLDINLGEYKIQFAKGPKDHKGLKSIEDYLQTKDFWRLRIGIENRKTARLRQIKGVDYVLERFTPQEKKIVGQVVKDAVEDLKERFLPGA